MLQNYFRITLRTLRRQRFYATINIGGLAVGMAACLLILLLVRHEWSYDRFHTHADRIYRVTMGFGDFGSFARIPAQSGQSITDTYPEIEAAVRMFNVSMTFQHAGTWQREEGFYYTDPALFEVFTFPLAQGDPATALQGPGRVVLTEEAAQRYFGTTAVIGEQLDLQGGHTLEVTGVLADLPANSHISFDFLTSFETLTTGPNADTYAYPMGAQSLYYIRVRDEQAAMAVLDKLNALADQGLEAFQERFGWWVEGVRFGMQPLTDIHLHSNMLGEAEPNGDVRYVYLFASIALFILLLAIINYINLSTARATQRSREVGVRKTLGAARSQLRVQFLGESLFFSLVALGFAIMIMELLLPAFNTMTGKELQLDYWQDMFMVSLFGGTALITGLLAGVYPAFALSRFDPVRALKGSVSASSGGTRLRKGLVTFQFALSVAMLIGTFVVHRQLHFIQNKRLGYDTTQVISLRLPQALRPQGEVMKAALAQVPGVEGVSLSSGPPISGMESFVGLEGAEEHKTRWLTADQDYLGVMGMALVAGRFFDAAHVDSLTFLANETAARLWGLYDQVGTVPTVGPGEKTLIGIVRDFHTTSLHQPIMPTFITTSERYGAFVVRLSMVNLAHTLEQLQVVWSQFVQEEPFIYHFMDDMLAEAYQQEQRLGRIFVLFSLLSIFIACLGLLGLAAFAAAQRTKEIGIRKVMGASVGQIVYLLSRDFLRLVLLAFVVALPLTYLGLQEWLTVYAYHVDLDGWLFVVAGIVTVAIALMTISYQAVRAALANPVDSLRYE